MASLPDHLAAKPAGRRRLPAEVLAEHQRRRVIAASIEVFAKRGYRATTIDQIVAASKVGVGSFYSLFDGKEDCFLHAYDWIVAEGRARIAAAVPAEASPPEQLCAALVAILDQIAAQPLAARIVLVEAQTAGPRGLARYEETLDALAPVLRRCRQGSPVAAELPAGLERATVGGLVWFLSQRVALGETESLRSALPDVLDIVLAPYLGEAEAERLLAAAAA
jgi:AcrR family transcriptional regulator